MIQLRVSGTKRLLQRLRGMQGNIDEKKKLLLERLADIGINEATMKFGSADYDGDNDVSVTPVPEWLDDNRLAVVASGKSILFIEFGTGLVGYGEEPKYAQRFGYGPGTFSDDPAKGGKGHWDDPKGWYYKHGVKTHGNPPAMAMYDAAKKMRDEIRQIAREVFNGD